MRDRYYPKADWRVQNFAARYPGSRINPNVLVMHTTETSGWPGYAGGGTAPHLTVMPDLAAKRLHFRQHFPFDMSSRALRNLSGGVQTNTLNAVQVELIGTCNRHGGGPGMDWTDPPEWALQQLAQFVAWFDAEWPDFVLQNAAPRGWLRYPDSYGNRNGQRLTFSEWRNAYGIVGHQHVPENSHGDPGNFPIKRLVDMASPKEPDTPEGYVAIPLTIGTFNNKGYAPMRLHEVNKGDYIFEAMGLDLYGEQERWVPGQLGGHRKIFASPVWERNDPLASSGTICGHRTSKFKRLAKFRFKATDRVLGVCGGRKATGEVLEFVDAPGATLTHFSLHLPPSAFSDRFKDSDRRKIKAREEWYDGVAWAKAFAERQIEAGRDFVVIETDSNSSAERLKWALGKTIAGKPVRVFTSQHGWKIDHIVVIGVTGKVVWEKGEHLDVPSDHNPFAVRLWFKVPVKR